MLKIEEVRDMVIQLGSKIGLEEKSKFYPMFSASSHVFNEGESIYVDESKYHYIIMERGKINKHYESEKIEDILYPLFKSITSSLASKYELQHRNSDEDSRKVRWSKQVELLENIDKRFAYIREKEIADILKISSYVK